MPNPSIELLRRAIEISEQIAKLEAEKSSILNGQSAPATSAAPRKNAAPAKSAPKSTGKRTVSPEARARIAEAQKARWAKIRAAKGKSK